MAGTSATLPRSTRPLMESLRSSQAIREPIDGHPRLTRDIFRDREACGQPGAFDPEKVDDVSSLVVL